MLQVFLFLVFILFIALGFSWLSDQPGSILINFAGFEALLTPTQFVLSLIIILLSAFLAWVLMLKVINAPALIASFFKKRREKRGLDALSSGIIAVGIGDRSVSGKYAVLAKKSLPNEPLTALLRAQSAQLAGDHATARYVYESMLESPDTELLGLRGLFIEAEFEKEDEAAFQYAERAASLNPKLAWAVNSLFQFQCKHGNWQGALETLELARQYKHMERSLSARRQAVLLTAQAAEYEDEDMDKALELALEAHKISPELVPAADIAGRILISKGQTSKAAKTLQRTWKFSPHPDLALTYSYARPGDSPRDRMQRVKYLASIQPNNVEGKLAVAVAAIEAKDWEEARNAIKVLIDDNPTQKVCTLMARIEGEQGDQGRMREWLARAIRAPRDPAWTADGYVSDRWLPVSPVTGEIDCFEWKVPVEPLDKGNMVTSELLPLEIVAKVSPSPELGTESVQSRSVQPYETEQMPPVSQSAEVSWTHGELTEFSNDEPKSIIPSPEPKDLIKSEESPALSGNTKDDQAVPLEPKKPAYAKKSVPESQKKSLPKYSDKASGESKIFVAPRAPDDPGTDSLDT